MIDMKVKFESRKYDVSFCDWVIIQFIKLKLLLKRQIRRAGVILSKQDVGLSLLITLFWTAFGIARYFWGQYCVATETEPYTVMNVAWDLSAGWFSSVVLSFLIGAYARIAAYKKKLHSQHETYVSTMEDFEALVDGFIGMEKNEYHPLYCKKCLDDTNNQIRRNPIGIDINNDDDMLLIIDSISDRLKKLDEEIRAENLLFFGEPLTSEDIDIVRRKITEHIVKESLNANAVEELMKMFLKIVDHLRRPWRIDIHNKINILERLNKKPENQILDDFYYSMLLQGHQFPVRSVEKIDSEKLSDLLKRIRERNQAKEEG